MYYIYDGPQKVGKNMQQLIFVHLDGFKSSSEKKGLMGQRHHYHSTYPSSTDAYSPLATVAAFRYPPSASFRYPPSAALGRSHLPPSGIRLCRLPVSAFGTTTINDNQRR
jgi:hypothetical protein